jgi:hypothetical protein
MKEKSEQLSEGGGGGEGEERSKRERQKGFRRPAGFPLIFNEKVSSFPCPFSFFFSRISILLLSLWAMVTAMAFHTACVLTG